MTYYLNRYTTQTGTLMAFIIIQVFHFRGQHHLEGIMLMENVPRSQLLTLIDKFSEVLAVTCTLPELHSHNNLLL